MKGTIAKNEPKDGTISMSAVEEVMAVEHEWVEAHRVVDIAAINRLMAEDYVRIHADGSVAQRAEVLASYESGRRSWDTVEGDQYDVRVYGDTALVLGRWMVAGINNAKRFDYSARILSVYHRRNGCWQMVAEQSTEIRK